MGSSRIDLSEIDISQAPLLESILKEKRKIEMNKFYAMGLMAVVAASVSVEPSMAAPFNHHGPDRGDIRRQEALVNQLQDRLNRDRKFNHRMVSRDMGDLRVAQAKLRAMEIRR